MSEVPNVGSILFPTTITTSKRKPNTKSPTAKKRSAGNRFSRNRDVFMGKRLRSDLFESTQGTFPSRLKPASRVQSTPLARDIDWEPPSRTQGPSKVLPLSKSRARIWLHSARSGSQLGELAGGKACPNKCSATPR